LFQWRLSQDVIFELGFIGTVESCQREGGERKFLAAENNMQEGEDLDNVLGDSRMNKSSEELRDGMGSPIDRQLGKPSITWLHFKNWVLKKYQWF
jgi:hypothetical protein